jgi:fibronectin type 3 domain-containing protein
MTRTRTLLIIASTAIAAAVLFIVVSAVIGSPTAHSVALTWNAPPPIQGGVVTGYNVYRSTTAGGPYVPIAFQVTATAYKDMLVTSGRTYYYVVTSVDSAGHESTHSEEVRAVIP